jgi:hypothetical protein
MRPAVPTLLMAFALTACTDPGEPQREARATTPPAATLATPDGVESATPARESLPCHPAVQRELVGRRHNIVGHSFAWPEPFMFPPVPDRQNKILWELQRPGHAADTADLLITASLNDSELVVHRRVEGQVTPGRTRPSIINVPEPGCWTFSLAWGAEHDTVSVLYRSSG